jgi:hypothetical protein
MPGRSGLFPKCALVPFHQYVCRAVFRLHAEWLLVRWKERANERGDTQLTLELNYSAQ